VKVERQADTTPFPAMRADARELVPYYDIRKGETERIAGYDCQSIILEPKDKLRYGHKIWADLATGMLVKPRPSTRSTRSSSSSRLPSSRSAAGSSGTR